MTTWALVAVFIGVRSMDTVETREVYPNYEGCAIAANSATLLARSARSKGIGKDLIDPYYACIPILVKKESGK